MIQWAGDDSCHREQEVAEQIESMIRRPFAETEVADFEIDVRTVRGPAFRLQLEIRPRGGSANSTRTIEGPSCEEVTDAAAVAIALTIGTPEEAASGAPGPRQSPLAEPEAKPGRAPNVAQPAATARVTPEPQSSSPERPRWQLTAGAVLDSAATPKPVLGGSARLSLTATRVRVELEGAVFATSTTENERRQGARFQLAYIAPLGCFIPRAGALTGLACVGYEVGQLSAEGFGVAVARSREQLWHAARAELGVSWALGSRLAVAGRLGGAFAFRRPIFVLDGPATVHRPAFVTLRAWLGLELDL